MENFRRSSAPIKSWSEDDRPREKMLQRGADSLSTSELLGINIGNGSREHSAVDLGRQLMQLCQQNLDELGKLSLTELQGIPGIGPAKAVSIAAAIELGRRRSGTDMLLRTQPRTSRDLADYLRSQLKDKRYEVFAVVYLNRANRIKSYRVISSGGLTGTVADPRVILKEALDAGATSIVLTHNHPSGNLQPSRADVDLTQKVKTAAAYFDIAVLDHIIVSDDGYYSFADEGLL